jgi:class 3 adenylate cyclase
VVEVSHRGRPLLEALPPCEWSAASQSALRQLLISEAAYRAAHLENERLEKRELQLKGKSEPVSVRVLHTADPLL